MHLNSTLCNAKMYYYILYQRKNLTNTTTHFLRCIDEGLPESPELHPDGPGSGFRSLVHWIFIPHGCCCALSLQWWWAAWLWAVEWNGWPPDSSSHWTPLPRCASPPRARSSNFPEQIRAEELLHLHNGPADCLAELKIFVSWTKRLFFLFVYNTMLAVISWKKNPMTYELTQQKCTLPLNTKLYSSCNVIHWLIRLRHVWGIILSQTGKRN